MSGISTNSTAFEHTSKRRNRSGSYPVEDLADLYLLALERAPDVLEDIERGSYVS